MRPINRRQMIQTTAAGLAAGLGARAAGEAPTPPEIRGPFYPVVAQKDRDFDLTQIEGNPGVALGEAVLIRGRVIDTDGAPIADATVDLWQANAAGRYRHPHDPNDAPLDPHFQGWAVVPSGADGGFSFKTVIPGTYPAAEGWDRPPHIHFKVSKRGHVELVTQMYFPGHPLNDVDHLLQRKTQDEQPHMIASRLENAEGEPPVYGHTIVLARA